MRLYRWMLRLYPAAFRAEYGDEMAQVFEDLCRDAGLRAGRRGLIGVWLRASADLWMSAWNERMAEMNSYASRTTVAGSVLLLPTTAFLLVMFSHFVLGMQQPYGAWDRFYTNPDYRTINDIIEVLTVAGPFAALLLMVVPVLRIQLARENGILVGTLSVRANATTLAAIGVAVIAAGVVAGYGFIEHFRLV